MSDITSIQSYLRENARRQYLSAAHPPFTCFFHPSDPIKYFNYAIPDQAVSADPDLLPADLQALAEVRAAFHSRGRVARFEFMEAFAPELPAALRRQGFVEEGRQWSMLCTPRTFRHAPVVPDLHLTFLSPTSPAADVREYLHTQQRGFSDNSAALPSEAEVESAHGSFERGWTALLGRVEGQPAGVAGFSSIISGICEVGGIATLEPFRRRGIGSYLSALTVQAAFERGAEVVCLTAEDERAGRVYERLGFIPFSIMLAYIDAKPVDDAVDDQSAGAPQSAGEA